ncbi:MAG: VWA domain-containing protein [Thermoanaerobaculia bacterium]
MLLAVAILAVRDAVAQEPPSRQGSVQEEALVERVVVDAYVTDSRGDPIPGLTTSDFRVRVDRRLVPLESAEWIPADTPEVAGPGIEAVVSSGQPTPELQFPEGRLLIFLFQTDYETSRLIGLMRMGIQARRLLDSLLPTDRVAVLSFDSHLKLRQDFTSDRRKLEAAISASLRMGLPAEPDFAEVPSLARHFDFHAAKKAVTPEKALALISRAAASIPGGKSMLFFGWGLGTISGMGPRNRRDQRDFAEAIPALAAARITIFTLDVTDADYHSLETSLVQISDLTGGIYQKTHIFPNLAMDRVRRAIAGRYVLVFKKPDGPRGLHAIEVSLARRKGYVVARTYYTD